MQDVDLNWIAIVVAAIVPMVLGALWYGPLFADPWLRAVGRTREELTGAQLGYVISAISAGTTYYSGRPRALFFINAGYWLVAMAIVGAIHGVWD